MRYTLTLILWSVFCLCCWCVTTAGCYSVRRPNGPVVYIASSSYLSPAQVAELSQKGQHGDAGAAFKLSRYYFEIEDDPKMGMKWTAVAATNGLAIAQHNLGSYYSNGSYPELTDIALAKYWLGKAAMQGDTNAMAALRDLTH